MYESTISVPRPGRPPASCRGASPGAAIRRLQQENPALVRTAVHEAAHVVCAHVFAQPTYIVSLDPQPGFCGAVWTGGDTTSVYVLRGKMIMLAAGGRAELRFDPAATPGEEDDVERMKGIAQRIVGLEAAPDVVHREMYLATCRAVVLVRRYWSQILAVAEALIEYRELVHGLPVEACPRLTDLDGVNDEGMDTTTAAVVAPEASDTAHG